MNRILKRLPLSTSKDLFGVASSTPWRTLTATLGRLATVGERVTIVGLVGLVVKIDDWVATWVFQERDLNVAAAADILRVPGVVVVLLAGPRECDIAVAAVEVADIDETAGDTAALRSGAGCGRAGVGEAKAACVDQCWK